MLVAYVSCYVLDLSKKGENINFAVYLKRFQITYCNKMFLYEWKQSFPNSVSLNKMLNVKF